MPSHAQEYTSLKLKGSRAHFSQVGSKAKPASNLFLFLSKWITLPSRVYIAQIWPGFIVTLMLAISLVCRRICGG